jgi:hypothetical protein
VALLAAGFNLRASARIDAHRRASAEGRFAHRPDGIHRTASHFIARTD